MRQQVCYLDKRRAIASAPLLTYNFCSYRSVEWKRDPYHKPLGSRDSPQLCISIQVSMLLFNQPFEFLLIANTISLGFSWLLGSRSNLSITSVLSKGSASFGDRPQSRPDLKFETRYNKTGNLQKAPESENSFLIVASIRSSNSLRIFTSDALRSLLRRISWRVATRIID